MNEINFRLSLLREAMKRNRIDMYFIPTDDYHLSEYVGDFFKCREYITGFTGSAGSAAVTQEDALLWVDGRYFLQGEEQTKDTDITLCRMGEPGVPEIHDYIKDHLKEGQRLGFDGRTVSMKEAETFARELKEAGAAVVSDIDLVGEIWEDRPVLTFGPVRELPVFWCGEERRSKMKRLRGALRDAGAEGIIFGALDDIAWLLNLRGCDVPCNPVFLSFLFVGPENAVLFADRASFDGTVLEALKNDNIEVYPYGDVYGYLRSSDLKSIWLTGSQVNSLLASAVPEKTEKIMKEDPVSLMKAVKNPTEIKNMKTAHIRDGAAVIRFIIWLKENVGKTRITEISAARKLLAFREEQENFMGESFEPIIAYGPHAAIVHYSATEETDALLKPRGLLLADTGGQYLEGTTDITRTIVLGPLTKEEKKYFTLVLKGHLHLLNAVFRSGMTGLGLDYLAREPLWRIGKDYNHGTGHGVGYYLNVHEGPNGFRWRDRPGMAPSAAFEEGMITSDEPGYYEKGKFGIRHESLILCEDAGKHENIQFLKFEPLTMVPFDPEGIDHDLLGDEDRYLLNAYHAAVYKNVSPFLREEERNWLKNEISRCETGGNVNEI